jgi:hypothetical protein
MVFRLQRLVEFAIQKSGVGGISGLVRDRPTPITDQPNLGTVLIGAAIEHRALIDVLPNAIRFSLRDIVAEFGIWIHGQPEDRTDPEHKTEHCHRNEIVSHLSSLVK